jgi:glutaredoxin
MVKLESFTAKPSCPWCSKLLKLVDTIKKEYGEILEDERLDYDIAH